MPVSIEQARLLEERVKREGATERVTQDAGGLALDAVTRTNQRVQLRFHELEKTVGR